MRLKQPFLADRRRLQQRLREGLELACSLGKADTSKIAVMGFGFGGLCALDLARSETALNGVISFYGHFEEAPAVRNQDIQSKVLLLHGADDPIVPMQDLLVFSKNLTQNGVDWQAQIFGKTLHAFMNPSIQDPLAGVAYNARSANRAWVAASQFLKNDVFACEKN